jgi:hypothetical protein
MERISCGPLQAPPGSGVHKEYTDSGAINNFTFDWHRQINDGEHFQVGGETLLHAEQTVSPEVLSASHPCMPCSARSTSAANWPKRDRKMHRLWEKHRVERELAA